MKQYINLTRIGHLLRHESYVGKNDILHMLAGFFIGFCCYFIICSLPFWTASTSKPADATTCTTWGAILAFVAQVFIVYAFSQTFSGLETTQKRTGFLMIPANTLEKYISRVIISAVIGFVGAIATFMLADCVHIILDLIITGQWGHSTIPDFFNNLSNKIIINLDEDYIAVGPDEEKISYNLTGLMAYTITFFILCSSAFRTKAFIKGIGIYSLVNTLTIIILVYTLYPIFRNTIDQYDSIITGCHGILLISFNIILWVMAALNIWWSYINVKRIQIV